jgi:pyridoxine kinase
VEDVAMSKQILLINDMAGYGKVALSAMIPVLSHMKYEVFNLPTALVSNTLDYGKFDILETTDYMKNTIRVWDELGFKFDAVSTGFIVSEEQTKLIVDYCKKRSEDGVLIFSDPIMGDDGALYNGITKRTVSLMRELISVADYIVPNYTEAAYLAGKEYQKDGATIAELHEIIDVLRGLGAKSVVITSCVVRDCAAKSVVGYDAATGEYFRIDFEEIPVRFPGTGDIFSAVFMGKVLEGRALPEATKSAMDVVREMIAKNAELSDKYKGVPLETCLELIDL